MNEPTQLVVSQEARDAAATAFGGIFGDDVAGCGWIRGGHQDDSQLVQAFQRAMNQSFLAGLEKALDKARGTNADLCKTPGEAYRLMLEAIRSLSIEEGGA